MRAVLCSAQVKQQLSFNSKNDRGGERWRPLSYGADAEIKVLEGEAFQRREIQWQSLH